MPDPRVFFSCKRCRVTYELNPHHPLTGFCETCRRLLGRRDMSDYDQWGLNQRYNHARAVMNAGGGPGVDPLRKYLIFQGDKNENL